MTLKSQLKYCLLSCLVCSSFAGYSANGDSSAISPWLPAITITVVILLRIVIWIALRVRRFFNDLSRNDSKTPKLDAYLANLDASELSTLIELRKSKSTRNGTSVGKKGASSGIRINTTFRFRWITTTLSAGLNCSTRRWTNILWARWPTRLNSGQQQSPEHFIAACRKSIWIVRLIFNK